MRLPKFSIPIIVAGFAAFGYFAQPWFIRPTTLVTFAAEANASAEFVVDGINCAGTGGYFTSMFNSTPGIASIKTYADDHRAVFRYDKSLVDANRIQEIFEAEIPLSDGTSRRMFTMKSASVEE